MKISFETDKFDRYIDKQANRFAMVSNRHFSTIFHSPAATKITAEEYVIELQKVLPVKVIYKAKENDSERQYIYEIEVEEKDYVMFLLKYDI